MTPLIEKLLDKATRLVHGGNLIGATAAIQRALGTAVPNTVGRSGPAPDGVSVLDGLVRKVGQPGPAAIPRPGAERAEVLRPLPATREPATPRPAPGFESSSYTGPSGTRVYKLFVPAGHAGKALPLIVMLHGCTQSPDDFAAGTRMNEVAQERGLLVLYPAQAPRSNVSKCWNWFVPADQRRGGGEPDLLAGMTRHVIDTHPVDPARVYVAGLSAGGAMADIMGREYPEIFAAVGVHSGLPQGAAHDIASAFAAMTSGASRSRDSSGALAVPAIVFHGDRDGTVHPNNGEQVIGAALASAGTAGHSIVATTLKSSAEGLAVTRTVHRREVAGAGEPSLAEHWIVHGAGHAWSGGSPAGSYTDARGPDATREMIRFFEEHPQQRA